MAFFKNQSGFFEFIGQRNALSLKIVGAHLTRDIIVTFLKSSNTNGKEALKQSPLDYVNYFLAEISLILDSH